MNNIPIEDRLAIQELTYRYAHYCDTNQLEKLMDLFADDGVFDETRLGAVSVRARGVISGVD